MLHVLGCILILGFILCVDDGLISVNVRVTHSGRKARLVFVCNKVIINSTGFCGQCANFRRSVVMGMAQLCSRKLRGINLNHLPLP